MMPLQLNFLDPILTEAQINQLILDIGAECDRLGWNDYQRRQWLEKNYQRRSRWLLPDDKLKDCLDKLRDL